MTASWRRNGIWTLAVLLFGGSLAYFLLVGKPAPQALPPPKILPPLVNVVVVTPGQHAISVDTQGTVRPVREINLVSQVAGPIESVSDSYAEGAFFMAGEELLKVEDVDYQFAISRAQSQVAAAKQRVAEEKGRALQASREWRDLGSVAANDLFLRKPQLASAQAALKSAEADLGAAQLNLDRTRIKVPFNGRISEKYVDLGQYVTPGVAIAKVYDTDLVQVRLPLTDRQVALLDLPLSYASGQTTADTGAEVILRARFASKQWEWQGRIVRTDANIDENSRVVYAVAEVSLPFARLEGSERPPLAPGLFVGATISGRDILAVSVVPRSALRSDNTVLLVDQEQRAVGKAVQVLHGSTDEVWVQGLAAGDRVIFGKHAVTITGMKVRINEAATVAGDPS